MDLGNGLGHLTYSTLVHPGDDWEQMWDSLTTYVPKVKARIAHNQRFGVSLRLVGQLGRDAGRQQRRARQAQEIPRRQQYVSLHRQRVSLRRVQGHAWSRSRCTSPTGAPRNARATPRTSPTYWRTFARTDISPSIQSAPLGFKPRVTGNDVVASFTNHVMRVAAHLVALEARTGRTVTLALEPEPYCFLETTDETVEYFTKHLYSGEAAETARQAGTYSDFGGACRAASPCRHRVRHLPPGGRVRGHSRVPAEAGRCRHSDLQAAGSGRAARIRR